MPSPIKNMILPGFFGSESGRSEAVQANVTKATNRRKIFFIVIAVFNKPQSKQI
jgi:hypothetical protein